MSGGIDSTVTALLLQKDGYEIIAITLVVSDQQIGSEDIEDAKKICKKLNIEHRIVDVREEFKDKVIKEYLKGYNNGETPSPCIICDEQIKFKTLKEIADKLGINYISTGHYCRIDKERFLLKKAKDSLKDQGYMLYRLRKDILKRVIFPLGDFTKAEIREIAKENGIEIYNKKDSQGICFAKEGYLSFLKNNLNEDIKEGNFVDKYGNILGKHQGYQLYTIGQRRGLGIKLGDIYFVIDIRVKENEVVLGSYADLYRDIVRLDDIVLNIDYNEIKDKLLIGRARFSSVGFEGYLLEESENYYFKYKEKNPHNARGQHIVLYMEDLIVGGGKIMF